MTVKRRAATTEPVPEVSPDITPWPAATRRRILLSVRNPQYLRPYDAVVRELSARGHAVHIVADDLGRQKPWTTHAVALASLPGVTFGRLPLMAKDRWVELGTATGLGRFYLRFLHPEYHDTRLLRARVENKAPAIVVSTAARWPGSTRLGLRTLDRALRVVEARLPTARALADYLGRVRPDVLLATPLIMMRSAQHDLLRAAETLGVPTVFGVGSWDHLSSKGLLRTTPTATIVWNETQRDEAVRWHGVPGGRVHVTGAQIFEPWFDRRPSVTSEALRISAGLDPAQPYILYVSSALLEGGPPEPAFVLRWMEAVRAHPALARVGLLVRPHPKRVAEWATVDVSRFGNASIWPAVAGPEADFGSDAYFHAMAHAEAVVGLNSSALVEAAILDRPVLTVLDPAYHDSQEGTLHFRYLTDPVRGLLDRTSSIGAHADALAAVLAGHDAQRDRRREFVRQFIRPRADRRPSAAIADLLESLAAAPLAGGAAARRAPWWIGGAERLLARRAGA